VDLSFAQPVVCNYQFLAVLKLFQTIFLTLFGKPDNKMPT